MWAVWLRLVALVVALVVVVKDSFFFFMGGAIPKGGNVDMNKIGLDQCMDHVAFTRYTLWAFVTYLALELAFSWWRARAKAKTAPAKPPPPGLPTA